MKTTHFEWEGKTSPSLPIPLPALVSLFAAAETMPLITICWSTRFYSLNSLAYRQYSLSPSPFPFPFTSISTVFAFGKKPPLGPLSTHPIRIALRFGSFLLRPSVTDFTTVGRIPTLGPSNFEIHGFVMGKGECKKERKKMFANSKQDWSITCRRAYHVRRAEDSTDLCDYDEIRLEYLYPPPIITLF